MYGWNVPQPFEAKMTKEHIRLPCQKLGDKRSGWVVESRGALGTTPLGNKKEGFAFFKIFTSTKRTVFYCVPVLTMLYSEIGETALEKKLVLEDIMIPSSSLFIKHTYLQLCRRDMASKTLHVLSQSHNI